MITETRMDLERLLGVFPVWSGLVDRVILRWPECSAREVFAAASALAQLDRRPELAVSDRPDIAEAAGCEAVQLRADGLRADQVATAFPRLSVGVSCHGQNELRRAHGAASRLLSPFALTSSKPGARPLGAARFRTLLREADGPVLALGGIGPENAAAALDAGAAGVAVVSSVWSASDPHDALRRLRAVLEREST